MTSQEEAIKQLRRIRSEHIEGRWGQLYELSKESGDSVIRYLFTVNAGGAVAVLAYLGTVAGHVAPSSFAKAALFFFFIGLLFVGSLRIYSVHHHEGLFDNYKRLVSKYYGDEIDWQTLLEEDEKKVGDSKVPYILGYSAFLSFVLGCIGGAVGII